MQDVLRDEKADFERQMIEMEKREKAETAEAEELQKELEQVCSVLPLI